MQQLENPKFCRVLEVGFVSLAILMMSGTAQAASSIASVIVSSPETSQEFSIDLYDSVFLSTPGGFAVASTSPNFGGSAMATASSTDLGHGSSARLFQSFTLPTFVTSGRLRFDFEGYAYATGQAVAEISYSLFQFDTDGELIDQALGAGISSDLPEFGPSGPLTLKRRHTFTLLGGETVDVQVNSAVRAGDTEGEFNFFNPFPSGPGYATAFIDPYVTFTPGIPEPGTWAMMIAGFGVIGLAARRRRAVHV